MYISICMYTGRLHVLKSTKWSARFCFTKTLYIDCASHLIVFNIASKQMGFFFSTHLMSEIKKNYFVTACSNQITPKIILPLMLSINRKAWKNRPMLKMFWILPLAENTTKIFFSDYKYQTGTPIVALPWEWVLISTCLLQ